MFDQDRDTGKISVTIPWRNDHINFLESRGLQKRPGPGSWTIEFESLGDFSEHLHTFFEFHEMTMNDAILR